MCSRSTNDKMLARVAKKTGLRPGDLAMTESTIVSVSSVGELSDFLHESAGPFRILGEDSKSYLRDLADAMDRQILQVGIRGILAFSPSDQVVTVGAGTPLFELQRALDEHGHCLPMVEWYDGYSHLNCHHGTVGGELSMNLPHILEGQCGTWKDWILGMRVVLADGSIMKAGSSAVKNVAGYDVHKLFVGARGTLGVVSEVTLRTYPVANLPEPAIRQVSTSEHWASTWVQRTRRIDFEAACDAAREFGYFADPITCTLWTSLPSGASVRRFEGDWVIGPGAAGIENPHQVAYMKRAKELFDPQGKLNPGEMGIF